MKPKNKTLLQITLILIIIALAFSYISKNLDDFKNLKLVNPSIIAIIVLIFIFSYFIIGLITLILLKPLGVKLKKSESFALSIITGFYNLFTPFKGGMAARAIYLKKKHNFTYTNFISSLAASYVLIFLVASISGIISTWIIYSNNGNFNSIIFSIFSITFISMLGIIFIAPKFKESKNIFLNRFIKVINGWHLIKNNPKVIISTIVLSSIQLILGSLMLYLQFKVFGINISFISALFLSSIGSIGFLIAITPSGLGISEAITVFSAASIGIGTAQSLSAALLGRIVQMAVLFILGPIFSYILLKKTNEN